MPCLIVGTQVDLREDSAVKEKLAKQRMSPVKREDGERMAKELGAVKYVECSALTQYKLKDVFDEVRTLNCDRLFLHPDYIAKFDLGYRRGAGTSCDTRKEEEKAQLRRALRHGLAEPRRDLKPHVWRRLYSLPMFEGRA